MIRNVFRVVSLLILLYPAAGWPQEGPDATAITEEDLDRQEERVNGLTGLSAAQRQQLLTELADGREYLAAAQRHRADAEAFQEAMDTAPDRTAHYEDQLKAVEREAASYEVTATSPQEIESQIALVEADRRSLAERRTEILREIEALPRRGTDIQQRLTELRGSISDMRSKLDTTPGSPQEQVTQLVDRAAIQAWTAEERSLQAEVISEPTRQLVRAAERAWVNQALAAADVKLQALAEAAEAALTAATREELETTEALAAKLENRSPRLEIFSEINRELGEQLQASATQTDKARKDAAALLAQLENLEENTYLINRRLEVVGHGELLGEVMIIQLENLPDAAVLKQGIKTRNELLTQTSHALIDVEERIRQLDQRQKYIAEMVPNPDSLDEQSRKLVDQLVDQQMVLLQDNLASLGSLVRLLVDNNVTAKRVITESQAFNDFLIGNLLWVQNFNFVSPSKLRQQLTVLFARNSWAEIPDRVLDGFLHSAALSALLLVFLSLLLLSSRLRKPYRTLLTTPNPLSGERVRNIFLGLGLSVLLVLPWPLLIYLLGSALAVTEPRTAFLDAIAPALQRAALFLFTLLLVRRLLNKIGVGRRYLKWDARMLDILRSELRWAGPLLIIAGFIETFSDRLDVVASGGPLGALATLVEAATIIVFCMRLLSNQVFREDRLTANLLRIVALLSVVTMALQLLGLLFAAEIYLRALGRSIVVLLAIKLGVDIMTRWLLIVRARLERRARDERKAQEQDGTEGAAEMGEFANVASLSEAHAKLLSLIRMLAIGVALWMIWSPSLPALALLDEITLWEISDSSNAVAGLRSITLFDLILAIIILVVTALVARHLPSLVRLFLLEWVEVSPGARYATSILLQYLVIAVGGSMFLTTIGWEWSRVQWLVAALGVGIGFGLQEIVANFISGIIILFERPIRVGDIITAGGAEGVVTEIKPRATIIETFDRKEHLIPNKELITGPVINWSLTDEAVRIVIPVGIAYGSDVRLALKLLVEAAHEVDLVLDEPQAMATFEDFGDSALLLWLRCYGAEDRPRVASELRILISEKFRDAGIEISFPQRDIHVDFTEPLQVALARDLRDSPASG